MTAELVVPVDSRWRSLEGFPSYWINQYGQVFSTRVKRVVKPVFSKPKGYPSVRLFLNQRYHYRGVPKLMREIFPEEIGYDYKEHS